MEPDSAVRIDHEDEDFVSMYVESHNTLAPGEVRQAEGEDDPLGLRKIDHVRFFVGNARQAAYFYRNAFGFDVVAYAGLETKSRQEAGYVLRQGDITFDVVSPLSARHPDNRRLLLHGDGVQDIALEVDNVHFAWREACQRGAIPITPPERIEDEDGVYDYATIQAYGDTTHTFVRSEEHTSELQSLRHLVCRLLLEKKKH